VNKTSHICSTPAATSGHSCAHFTFVLKHCGCLNAGLQDSCPTLLQVYQRAEALWHEAALPSTSPQQAEAAVTQDREGVKPEELCSALVCGAELLLDQIRTLQPPNLTLGGWLGQLQEQPEAAKAAVERSISPIELFTCGPLQLAAGSTACPVVLG
jgi:hypothetical protein